jgi:large subunit ribosomal protein L17
MNRKLGRKKSHRENMLKNLAISLVLYEKITTTKAKAKEVHPLVEKYINIGKKNDLASKRYLLAHLLHNKMAVKKITDELAIRYKKKSSGFIKKYYISNRLGDNAPRTTLILADSKFLIKPSKLKAKNDQKITKNN